MQSRERMLQKHEVDCAHSPDLAIKLGVKTIFIYHKFISISKSIMIIISTRNPS